MTKTIFIIVASVLSIIVIILMLLMLTLQVRKEEIENAGPTPLPTLSPTFIPVRKPSERPTPISSLELAVAAIYPENMTVNFPIHNSYIELTFNQRVSLKNFIFSIAPDIKYKPVQTKPEVVRYVFQEPLQPATAYRFRVNTLSLLPVTYTFTTQTATESAGM